MRLADRGKIGVYVQMKPLGDVPQHLWKGARVVARRRDSSLDIQVGDTGTIIDVMNSSGTVKYVPDKEPTFMRAPQWDTRVAAHGFGWWQLSSSYFTYVGRYCLFGGEHDSVHETEAAE